MVVKSMCLTLALYVGFLNNDETQHLDTVSTTGNIQIEIEGLENYNGYIQVDIYKTNKGFPTKNEFAYKKLRFKVSNTKSKYNVSNLSYGTYALAIYHDENSNKINDTNFFGIPKEKIGASNNPSSGYIPSFNEAKFELKTVQKNITVKLK